MHANWLYYGSIQNEPCLKKEEIKSKTVLQKEINYAREFLLIASMRGLVHGEEKPAN